ncbi:MAG: MOSC domain-containing protein [Solirubrobacterales bacterium]|nr:MOSC domain-containing protein [Solirubrobacterales bacterium]
MTPRSPRISWISIVPVKGLRMQTREEALLTRDGIPGDRAFFVVDRTDTMISATRLGPLVAVVAEHDARTGELSLRFPDGREVAGEVELGDPEEVGFAGETVPARTVLGPFSPALSDHCDRPVRLVSAAGERPGVDRGRDGAVTLLSIASLERLRAQAGELEPVDARRFRMNLGVAGLEAHEEDDWVDREIRVGDALLRVAGHVGRCAATTRNAETGVVDFETLHHLQAYRGRLLTTEPLPFGVHARVVEPGRVRLDDPVTVAA